MERDRDICYGHEGYQQGFIDGKRTEGNIKSKYIENLLKIETQSLSSEESLKYQIGWQNGFTDAVSRLFISKGAQKNGLICPMIEL
jgi:hypothetical protein